MCGAPANIVEVQGTSIVNPKRKKMLPSGLYLLALLFLSTASGETVFDWEHLESTLPLGISDHTATRSGDIVYLAGGCDAEQGNIWDADAKFFLCLSISQSLFGYDIVNDAIIDDFPDMPVARYRHAAVAANNKIWLVGGRDVEDSPINQVDVRYKMFAFVVTTGSASHNVILSFGCYRCLILLRVLGPLSVTYRMNTSCRTTPDLDITISLTLLGDTMLIILPWLRSSPLTAPRRILWDLLRITLP